MGSPSIAGDARQRAILTLLLGGIAAAGAADLWLDLPHSAGAGHMVFEAALLVLSLGAVTVYSKSNLSGRAELAAFFLEDLLLPALKAARAGRGRPLAGA